MAPLPANNTSRLFFDYVTGNAATSQEHTFAVRVAASQDISQPQIVVANWLAAIGAARFATGWRLLRCRVQVMGTSFSVPANLNTALTNFVGSGGTISPPNEAIELTFQGRSPSSGRRVDLSLFGTAGFALTSQFRLTVTEAAWVGAAVAVMNDNEGTAFLAIDGSLPTWYPYANWNYNSYWEAELRT